MVGRVVQVNKHPFTILGVAPPAFQGTLLFFFPDFWSPVVNHEQVQGTAILNGRRERMFFMAFGHLKPGVTQAQAIGDLNSIGSYLEKTYPKDDANMTFALARPSLAGDLLGPPVKGFVTGLMLLSGLILLAACANLGSLFAARAADRSREIALRLALGSSRKRVLRGVFTEAVLISIAGGFLGLLGSIALLRELSAWQPIPSLPAHAPVDPDASVYLVALLFVFSQRISLWRGPGEADTPHQSVRGGEGWINRHYCRQCRTPDYHPRRFARGANCDLCGARDCFAGCRAGAGSFDAQQFRI